ncbi:uncharacterized protein C1orf100 [Poecilia latipinna]|uniref:uncharacterized protein C1orf100 n=1 Tax=Poecilia latipinna TaxID=48699 RepID=UPI00072E8DDC|nr:PREDICTED: uncharacterized protein C1orf100 homolog [Poecilia latipinna]
MAGSGIAIRLHEFRQSQDSKELDWAAILPKRTSCLGRDVRGLYPGQVARVHTMKDCGSERSSCLQEVQPPESPYFQPSFDFRTLRALSLLRQDPDAWKQRHHQTTYQEHFGLQSVFFPQS